MSWKTLASKHWIVAVFACLTVDITIHVPPLVCRFTYVRWKIDHTVSNPSNNANQCCAVLKHCLMAHFVASKRNLMVSLFHLITQFSTWNWYSIRLIFRSGECNLFLIIWFGYVSKCYSDSTWLMPLCRQSNRDLVPPWFPMDSEYIHCL